MQQESIQVLHVDDELQFGELTKTILESEYDTFEVIIETNPREVLELINYHDIDCLVSDYDMPEMDGIELLERVREEHSTLPVILFTGKGTEEVASRAISAGVTEYLQKEGGTDQFTILANRIRNAVEKRVNKRKRDQYQTVVETAGDAMYVLDEDGYIEIVNEAFERMAGYDRDELIGSHASEFLSSDQIEQGTEAIQSLLRDDERDAEQFTFRANRPDGESRLYETTVSLVERDGLAGSVGTVRDITEERRTEKLLSGLFEESLHGIGVKEVVTDESGNPVDYIYKRVNDRFEELTGLDADEVAGERATDVIDGIEDTPFIDIFGEVALEGTTVQFEQYFEPLDRYYEVSAFSPRHGECISIFSEITERKKREQTLEELVQQTESLTYENDKTAIARTAVEIASDVIDVPLAGVHFISEDEKRLKGIAVNDDVREEFTAPPVYSRDDDTTASKLTWQVFDSSASLYIEDVEEYGTLAEETPVKSGIIHSLGDHGVFIISTTVRDGFNETERYLVELVAQTLTAALDRAEREADLRASKQRLQRQSEQLDEFTGVISHDLRNPINVAAGHTELVAEECDSEHISDVREALSRMEALIEDLLTLARQGETVGEREQIALRDVVSTCWHNVETGDTTITTDGQATLAADRGRVAQVLENLFRNAVEHGGESVTVGVLDNKRGFYVADDGPGIPEADREVVFDRGYTTNNDGTGFGLAIVSRICAAHGWDITATESENGGARIEITGVEFIN
jgi:PAS domain S-box-containing protein